MRPTERIQSLLNCYVSSGALAAVVYNSPTKANVELDTTAHPCAVLYVWRDGTVDLSGGTFSEIDDVNVLFLTHQPQLDFDGVQNDALMDAMVDLATRFVGDVIAADIGTIEGNEIALHGLYDYDDKNTTGVSLQFRIRSHPQCL